MEFTLTQAQALIKKLPDLGFGLHLQPGLQNDKDLQAYLSFYQLPSLENMHSVHHAIGLMKTEQYQIAVQYWLPENARGTVFILHGYFDHVGIFGNAIRQALAEGYVVVMFDLPGHGLSSGKQAWIDNFDSYGDIFNQLVELSSTALPAPFLAWGQSTGCAVLLNHLWRYEAVSRSAVKIQKRLLFAPLIVPRAWFSHGRWVYACVHLFIKYLKRKKSDNCHDTNFLHFIDHLDPLQSKRLSVEWVGAMKKWPEQCQTFSPLPEIDLAIVQGTADGTVDWQFNLQQIQQLLPNASISLIENAGHQLVNEIPVYRNQAFSVAKNYLFS